MLGPGSQSRRLLNPVRNQRKPLTKIKEKAIAGFVEYQHMPNRNPQQKSKELYFPVAGIARHKQDDGIESLPSQLPKVLPAVPGFRMGQNLVEHRVFPEASDDLRPVAAEERVARISEWRLFPEPLQSLQYVKRIRRLQNQNPLSLINLIRFINLTRRILRFRLPLFGCCLRRNKIPMIGGKRMSPAEDGMAAQSLPGEVEFISVSADYADLLWPQPQRQELHPAILSFSRPKGEHYIKLFLIEFFQRAVPLAGCRGIDLHPWQPPKNLSAALTAEHCNFRLRIDVGAENLFRFLENPLWSCRFNKENSCHNSIKANESLSASGKNGKAHRAAAQIYPSCSTVLPFCGLLPQDVAAAVDLS